MQGETIYKRPQLPAVYSASVHLDTGRIEWRFVSGSNHRVETSDPAGRPLVIIRRADKGLVWVLHLQHRVYFESKISKVDALLGNLLAPVDMAWHEARRSRIDGILYRHFIGKGRVGDRQGEEHIFVDPVTNMFRREIVRVGGIRTQVDYLDVDLNAPPDELFSFDRKSFTRAKA